MQKKDSNKKLKLAVVILLLLGVGSCNAYIFTQKKDKIEVASQKETPEVTAEKNSGGGYI